MTPVNQARSRLPALLDRFAEEGPRAQPMILGRHRRAEAAVIPFELFQAMLELYEDELAVVTAIQQARARAAGRPAPLRDTGAVGRVLRRVPPTPRRRSDVTPPADPPPQPPAASAGGRPAGGRGPIVIDLYRRAYDDLVLLSRTDRGLLEAALAGLQELQAGSHGDATVRPHLARLAVPHTATGGEARASEAGADVAGHRLAAFDVDVDRPGRRTRFGLVVGPASTAEDGRPLVTVLAVTAKQDVALYAGGPGRRVGHDSSPASRALQGLPSPDDQVSQRAADQRPAAPPRPHRPAPPSHGPAPGR